jgi:outer membrane protein assembly factor BamB
MISPRFRCVAASVACLVAFAVQLRVLAEDWPQWRGPKRDDINTETGLLKKWPEGGPPRAWLVEDCGLGYSGPAVVGDTLYILGARDKVEQLVARDVATGKELWHTDLGPMLENNWGDGPRSTPTVDGDMLYVLDANGVLACVKRDGGEIVWTKTMQDLGGALPTWGYCESPLIYKDLVLCTPGGGSGSIAALKKDTGELAWQAKDLTNAAHYSSCVLTEREGKPEVVQLLPEQVVGLDPDTGAVRWKEPFPGRVAVIPTPIVKDDKVYVTAGYGVGCMLVKIGADDTVEKVYENKEMKNHHGGVILIGDCIYGHSDGGGWMCQDMATGERKWLERDKLGKGSIACADGMFYCFSEDDGIVALVEPSTEGWNEHSRFTLAPLTDQRKQQGKIWTHPVISGG